jgi:probable phosphoglycerate mutase
VTLIALVRHMPTAWNAAARMQGGSDQPLDPGAAPAWRLPPEFAGFRALSSPLRRAVETAERLGLAPRSDARLGEMAWGAWEGRTLAELRVELGPEMADMEARGLDFRPPGGESPRDVQARLVLLFAELAAAGTPAIAITHKGVIRAALALATGWDMRGKPPYRLSWHAAHLFAVDRAGRPAIERLNLPLEG